MYILLRKERADSGVVRLFCREHLAYPIIDVYASSTCVPVSYFTSI